MCKKLCRGLPDRRKETMVRTVMGWKMREAYESLREEKRRNTRVWREEKQIIQRERVGKTFDKIWEEEKRRNMERHNHRRTTGPKLVSFA